MQVADIFSANSKVLSSFLISFYFASRLVKRLKEFDITSSDAYLLGMFSTLEYMIDAPMDEILSEIPIVYDIKKALISKEGQAGRLYELILCYEKAEWSEIKEIAEELGLQTNEMAQIYMECVEEVNEIWENVVGSREEK